MVLRNGCGTGVLENSGHSPGSFLGIFGGIKAKQWTIRDADSRDGGVCSIGMKGWRSMGRIINNGMAIR